ncbi:MAG: hypothetical protein ACTSQP_22275 [Promethearchaeota archaeon]
MSENIYSKLIKRSILRNPKTNPDLCLYTPTQTLYALKNNEEIRKWHYYIIKEYNPEPNEICLLFPCAAYKPWTEGLTKSKNYQILYNLLNEIKIRDLISLHTISEPLAIVGEKDYDKMPIYDNPGLFKWFTEKNKLYWNQRHYEKCIIYLGFIVGKFLEKVNGKFKRIFAFVKPHSNYFKILQIAHMYSRVNIIIGPTIKEMGKLNNIFVWMANKNIRFLFKKYISNLIT